MRRSVRAVVLLVLLAACSLVLVSLAGGCFRRQGEQPAAPPPPGPNTPPPPGSEETQKARWAALEPGIKLVYRDEATGEEVWSERCAPSTLADRQVIPVIGDDEDYVSYVAEDDGWLVEVGARDPNGRAAWPQPLRLYPLVPAVGMTWDTEGQAGIARHEIEAIEEISTPAGGFRAARVVVKTVDPASGEEETGSEYRFWYDQESGIVVKSSDLILIRQEKVEPRPDPGLAR